jgi:aryl-alcohol dehydrogenase-like predicted oxidoreductase
MTNLPVRTLGRTGVSVTTLGFGAMELRGADPANDISDAESDRLLNAVLDSGITIIDTSPDYGRSEERIGRGIAHRRSEYFLASKCGCVPGAPGGSEHVHTAANIRAAIEQSLRLMKTDHLDLVQFHRSLEPEGFDEEGALSELQKLQAEGKVRFLGVSATLPNMWKHVDMGIWDAFQVPYSALQREHEDVIAKAAEAGAGIIVRGGAARGLPSDWQGRNYYMQPGTIAQDRWEAAGIDGLLDGMSRMEFTLRFTLSHPDLDTTIVGTKSRAHLADNIAVAQKGPLPDNLLAEAKRRLAAAGSAPE